MSKKGEKRDRYPWQTLEVGQSFLVKKPPRYWSSSLHTCAAKQGYRIEAKMTVRGNVRVKRVA